jgi:rhodanese-related sulfurtransferase
MSVPTITPARLEELRTAGKAVDLIDIRTLVEYREVHVAFARNVPLDRLDPVAVRQQRIGSPEEPLYVICRSGSRGRKSGRRGRGYFGLQSEGRPGMVCAGRKACRFGLRRAQTNNKFGGVVVTRVLHLNSFRTDSQGISTAGCHPARLPLAWLDGYHLCGKAAPQRRPVCALSSRAGRKGQAPGDRRVGGRRPPKAASRARFKKTAPSN